MKTCEVKFIKTCSEYSIILSKNFSVAKEQSEIIKETLKSIVEPSSKYTIVMNNYNKVKVIVENNVLCFQQDSFPNYYYYEDLNLGDLCNKEKIRDALFYYYHSLIRYV